MYSAQGACRVNTSKFTFFTGKLQVMHVNCVWGLVTCSQLVKLPAFASNFAQVSFTEVQTKPQLVYLCTADNISHSQRTRKPEPCLPFVVNVCNYQIVF